MSFFIIMIQLLALYLCVHVFYAFNEIYSKTVSIFIALAILIIGESFLFFFVGEYILGIKIPKLMFLLSYIAMVVSFYLIIIYIISDVFKLVNLYPSLLKYKFSEFLIFTVIALSITGYGYYNAQNTKLKEVLVTTDKPNIDFSIMFLSDLHIGTIALTKKRMEETVNKINSLSPDIIILGGDIVDNRVSAISEGGFGESLKNLSARYGVYAVLGNHEYYRNKIDNVEKIFEFLGMSVLRDETFTIKPLNIDIIGLDDKTKIQTGQGGLKPIKSLINGDKFKILISHNPIRQAEAVSNGIDLFLAGHTHAGQLYPMELLLKYMYDTVYGYDKFEKTQVYVSSGLGAWGPPVRIGNDSEIVLLKVKSK